jgi:hypothetical protein
VIETEINSELRARKELVTRIVSSDVICKSARLRELFLYLCHRVLDESADHINELELGHHVFGKPQFYDTAADNTVRVHASTLRKRLADYFQTQGRDEPVIIEVPRGNYAPVFKSRDLPVTSPLPNLPDPIYATLPSLEHLAVIPAESVEPGPAASRKKSKLWAIGLLALFLVLASVAGYVFTRVQGKIAAHPNRLAAGTEVRRFWSSIFVEGTPAQLVLDDATLDFYQQITGQPVALGEYFDRSYLNAVDQHAATAHLDAKLMRGYLMRRQSNFADVNLIGRLTQTAGALGSGATTVFSRDFSFRQLKSGNIILLGTSQSNPWIQPFEAQLAVRWKMDPVSATYYPRDTTIAADPDKYRPEANSTKPREGYATIALLPDLGGNGNVLILSGTGGSAVAATLDFLSDERSLRDLRSRLGGSKSDAFPPFEAMLEIDKGANMPGNILILMCRPPQQLSPHTGLGR